MAKKNPAAQRHKAATPRRRVPKYPVPKKGPTGREHRLAKASYPAARAATLAAREERAKAAAAASVRVRTNWGTLPDSLDHWPDSSNGEHAPSYQPGSASEVLALLGW